jgi:MSHA biogenesis protein MshG
VLRFSYTGRNKNGKLVEGFVEALNKDAVAESLKRSGITPIAIRISTKEPNAIEQFSNYLHSLTMKPRLSDLIIFARQMYSLTKSGVPLLRSLRVLADNVKSEGLRISLEDILVRLDGGQSFSAAVGKHPAIFPGLVQSLISVGESTGDLDEIFRQVSIYLDRENDTKKRIKSAMRYPIIVMITIIIAIAIINVLVVPAFAQFFQRFGSTLPLPTRILIASSNFMINYWYIIILGIILSIVAWVSYLKTDSGRMKWDRLKLKIPLIGSIIERSLLARFARSFALTSRTGVPLLEAIAVIAKTTDNVFVAERILSMRQGIEHGESLTSSARNCGMFSSLVMQMMTIGEETGEVDRLLDEVADFYERELEYDLKKLSEAIEPILIIIVAGMVLVLALGVFLPMWDLSKVALGK